MADSVELWARRQFDSPNLGPLSDPRWHRVISRGATGIELACFRRLPSSATVVSGVPTSGFRCVLCTRLARAGRDTALRPPRPERS